MMRKTKGMVLVSFLIISVAIAMLLGWRLQSVSIENQQLQFVQDRIDTDFLNAMSSLNSDWLNSDSIQWDAVQYDIGRLEALLPVTSYQEAANLDKVVKAFIGKAKKAEAGSDKEELWEAMSTLTFHLSKPLPADIDQYVENVWDKLQ